VSNRIQEIHEKDIQTWIPHVSPLSASPDREDGVQPAECEGVGDRSADAGRVGEMVEVAFGVGLDGVDGRWRDLVSATRLRETVDLQLGPLDFTLSIFSSTCCVCTVISAVASAAT